MAMTNAERQRAYLERRRVRMAEDPVYAAEVKARKATSDRKYYEANKDKWAYSPERHVLLMQTNPSYAQRKRNDAKIHAERNREKVLARKKAYRENNAETISEYMAKWELENRDKRYAITAKRNYNLESTSVEPISRSFVWERDEGVCGICKDMADPENWHMDHIMPLSKGGSHTMDNVQVSHPKCNLSKGATIITEV